MTYDEYAAEIQRLQDALARVAHEAVSQWISVEDEKPKPYVDALVCMYLPFRERNKQVVTLSYYLGDDDDYFFEEDAGIEVTHWMPLPAPPICEDSDG